ncbi:NAD(P)-dependent oxidoreductase [Amycolatopsis sp. A133]|uniref:NAD(P)-dependent oxidoreductase n=1 Tax=Amycolatopsis sp. A133 TaxID=3064472 RepID=UPI0027EFA616|nr:NAD(P)-dependent oxidoreductase [Amycolatopsis sp. A133]MDQ7803501.1 NAD(P)-dependent oxidoreductase [Amycolatopsis sp. A133]
MDPTAVLGLGNMGAGMACRLLAAGFPVTVYNRSPAKAAALVTGGAVLAKTPAEAVAGARAVLVSLGDEAAVEQVLFGQALPALTAGQVVIDTSTVSPTFARAAAARLVGAGLRRVEACVLGNPHQARAGELRVLAAGAPEDVESVRDLLDVLGREVRYVGPPGNGASTKLVFNLLLGAQLAALAEAVSYGVGAGLDRELLLSAIEHSGFSSRVLAFRAALMREARYEPAAFRARLMAKDLDLVTREAAALGVELPVTTRAAERFAEVVAAGLGDLDAAVIGAATVAVER